MLFRMLIHLDPELLQFVAAFVRWGQVPKLSGIYVIFAPLTIMLFMGIIINVAVGIFNLIPIPPLDGGRIVYGILPMNLAREYARLERWGILIVLALILIGGVDRYFGYVVLRITAALAGVG